MMVLLLKLAWTLLTNILHGVKRDLLVLSLDVEQVWVTDEYGNKIEVGYKSEIIGVTLKDNPDVVRGKIANLIMFEEAGSFKELSAAMLN